MCPLFLLLGWRCGLLLGSMDGFHCFLYDWIIKFRWILVSFKNPFCSDKTLMKRCPRAASPRDSVYKTLHNGPLVPAWSHSMKIHNESSVCWFCVPCCVDLITGIHYTEVKKGKSPLFLSFVNFRFEWSWLILASFSSSSKFL